MPIVVRPSTQRTISVKLNRSSLGVYQQSGLPVDVHTTVIGSVAISNLTDVNYSAPTDGNLLAFNSTSGKWEVVEASEGGEFEFPDEIDGGTF